MSSMIETLFYISLFILILLCIALLVRELLRKKKEHPANVEPSVIPGQTKVETNVIPVQTMVTLAIIAGGMAGFTAGIVKTDFALKNELSNIRSVGNDQVDRITKAGDDFLKDSIIDRLRIRELNILGRDDKPRIVLTTGGDAAGVVQLLGDDQKSRAVLTSNTLGGMFTVYNNTPDWTTEIGNDANGGASITAHDEKRKQTDLCKGK